MSDLIELEELRIGNILAYKGELHYVSSLSLDIDDEYQELIGVTPVGKRSGEKCDWNRALVNDLKRVSLEHDVLSKIGYQYANENGQKFYWHIDLPYFQLRQDDDGDWLMWHEQLSNEILITQEGFLYIHQLQNIYKTLSGKELNIKNELIPTQKETP